MHYNQNVDLQNFLRTAHFRRKSISPSADSSQFLQLAACVSFNFERKWVLSNFLNILADAELKNFAEIS